MGPAWGADGTQKEFQKEWRTAPTQANDWMQQMRVYYTTLMMVLSAHKEHTKLTVDWTSLKASTRTSSSGRP